MVLSHRGVRVAAIVFCVLMLAPSLPAADAGQGRVVTFPRPGTNDTLVRYDDTLFVGLDPVSRVAFDDAGDVWYATYGGVVHEHVGQATRDVYTRLEGLPESVALALAVRGPHVFVATDLGLAVVDRASGAVTNKTPANSPLPDAFLTDVALVGDEVWLGTHDAGIVRYNPDTDAWAVKNTSTTAFRPKAITRLTVTNDTVWAATDGDGVWRYDRARDNWTFLIKDDGLFTPRTTAVAEYGRDVYIGTVYGLVRWRPDAKGTSDEWRRYNESQGMPDKQVNKLSVLPTTDGKTALLVDTKVGVWEYDPETGANQTLAQGFGIFGSYVMDDAWSPTFGWAFATQRGVSLLREGAWTYFTTGPSSGGSNGPSGYRFTSGSTGDSGGFLWFGRPDGISAYQLPLPGKPGRFWNFGSFDHVPGGLVSFIDTEGNTTWFATSDGAFGYNQAENRWVQTPVHAGLTYGLDADRGDLYVATFGAGLYMLNTTTGRVRGWNDTVKGEIPDVYLTDVRATANDVWLGSSTGVIRMNRVAGTVLKTFGKADGLPGDGNVYRVLPDGPYVYAGMRKGGVAQIDVANGQVSRVWNSTNTPGFPDSEVDVLLREGGRLWVGTKQGLVRIDVATGAARHWGVEDGLVQEFVTGIQAADGILYLSTYSGIARLDVANGTFYPMQDAPGVVRVGAGATGSVGGSTRGAVSVRFDAPKDGSAVAGVVELRGSAIRLGGGVDRVEVRIGEGAWQAATGNTTWSYSWDTTKGPLNTPIPVFARAVAGNVTSPEAEILLTPVAEPTIPLSLAPVMPDAWTAGRAMPVSVGVKGDEPLSATLYYMPAGAHAYTALPLVRQGSFFTGTIPARDAKEGELAYYFEARSGLLAATSPEAPDEAPAKLLIDAAPHLGVRLGAPASVAAQAGLEAAVPLTLTNTGTEPVSVRLVVSGLRFAWAHVPDAQISLDPGESRTLNATFTPPAAAFEDNTTLAFEAQDVDGVAQPARADVPVHVLAVEAKPAGAATQGAKPTPGFAAPLAFVALAGALLVLRRRSA